MRCLLFQVLLGAFCPRKSKHKFIFNCEILTFQAPASSTGSWRSLRGRC